YRLETRVFVLDTPPRGLDVAFYSILHMRAPGLEHTAATEPSSVRLELARVSLQGHLTAAADVNLAIPLDGPSTLECGAFIDVPDGRINLKNSWEVSAGTRPAQVWRFAGSEIINNTRCLRLEAVQQSDDWNR